MLVVFNCNLSASYLYLVDLSTSKVDQLVVFKFLIMVLTMTGLILDLICIHLSLVFLEKILIGFTI
jgi:hypothetical protein